MSEGKKKKQSMILQKSYSWKSLYSSHQSKKSSHFICVMNKDIGTPAQDYHLPTQKND